MPRHILVIHNNDEAPSLKFSTPHRYLEMPLNHMGYVADYANIQKDIPARVYADRYAGIVTWFSGGMSDSNARKLTQWLRTKREEGMPVATFEDVGYSPDRETARSLGLTPVPPAVGTISIDSQHAMIGFEAQPRPTRST